MSATTERDQRWFWYVGDYEVELALGYECTGPLREPGNPTNMWWIPEKGFSCSVGKHIFDTRANAEEQLHANLIERMAQLKAELRRVKEVLRHGRT